MSKVLSDDNRDPFRYDPSPKTLSPAQSRGWRTRAEAGREPCTPMTKEELEIERLNSMVVSLESMLHEISASLIDGPDIGPDLPAAVKSELSALSTRRGPTP